MRQIIVTVKEVADRKEIEVYFETNVVPSSTERENRFACAYLAILTELLKKGALGIATDLTDQGKTYTELQQEARIGADIRKAGDQ